MKVFRIYQLKPSPKLRYHRFTNLALLHKEGNTVDKDNYNLVYTAIRPEGTTYDMIFEELNLFRPSDFKGHSLSISDVIVDCTDGEAPKAVYVDSLGFKDVPEFFGEEVSA